MKSKAEFRIVIGDNAYEAWYAYNDSEINMEIISEYDQNLELIMDTTGDILAFRSNSPMILARMFKRNGAWEFTESSDLLCEKDLFRLQVICRNFAFN